MRYGIGLKAFTNSVITSYSIIGGIGYGGLTSSCGPLFMAYYIYSKSNPRFIGIEC